jgi:YidC/Oxa1 family membrane protein insertase
MDRNQLTGLILVGILFLAYVFYFSPTPKKQKENNDKQTTEQLDTSARPQAQKREKTTAQQQPGQSDQQSPQTNASEKGKDSVNYPAPFNKAAKGDQETVTLENEVLKLKLSTKGGNIAYAELKEYEAYNGDPLVLIDSANEQLGYRFFYQNQKINTNNLFFKPSTTQDVRVTGNDSAVVTMRMDLGDDRYMEQKYTLQGDGYMVDYDINLYGFNKIIPRNVRYLNLNWQAKLQQQEESRSRERNRSGLIFKFANGEVDWISERGSGTRDLSSGLKWVSFKQQFFSQTLIADEAFNRAVLESQQSEDLSYLEQDRASLTIPFNHNNLEHFGMQFYIGPNHYHTLADKNLQLEEQLSLGWGPIGWINKGVIIPAFNILDNFIGSYGVIIIILTVLIKIALSPLTYKSFMSQAKMRALKPELDELKQKHGNDMQKMQMEQMKLYRKAGINPMGGCLPMLLQLPFLVAMFHFYPASIELRQESFLWAEDLSTYDSIFTFPGNFAIPFYGDHVSLFTLLMAGSTMLYSWYNQKMTPTSNDQMGQQMKIMTYIMPFFILFIFNGYSAGLSCYYFFYNIFSFLQTYMFKQLVNEDKVRSKIEANKKKPAKKSSFQQRLEDMAKQQQNKQQGAQTPKKQKK